MTAEYPLTRERFMGLYEITSGKSATQIGRETGCNPQTVMVWVHHYNQSGPNALFYMHTGGPPPWSTAVKQGLDEVICDALTQSRSLTAYG